MKSSRVSTFLAFAAGTVVVILSAVVVTRLITTRSLEHLARLAGGESDYQRHHPSRDEDDAW